MVPVPSVRASIVYPIEPRSSPVCELVHFRLLVHRAPGKMLPLRASRRLSIEMQLSTVRFASSREQCPEPSPPIFFQILPLVLPKSIGTGRLALDGKTADRTHSGGLGG